MCKNFLFMNVIFFMQIPGSSVPINTITMSTEISAGHAIHNDVDHVSWRELFSFDILFRWHRAFCIVQHESKPDWCLRKYKR